MEEPKVETQEPQISADELIRRVRQNPTPPPTTEIQLPDGLEAEKLNAFLKDVIGIEDYTKLPTLKNQEGGRYKEQYRDLSDRYTKLQSNYGQLQAQAQMDPFASPFVKKINEMHKTGATPSEIAKYASLHSKDITSMSLEEAYKERLRMENPGMENEIPYLMDAELGIVPEKPGADAGKEDLAKYTAAVARRNANLKMRGAEAKKWIGDQLTSFEDPEAKKRRADMDQKRSAYQQSWSQVASQMVNADIKLGFKIEDKEIGNYEHPGFDPKMTDTQKKQVAEMVGQYAVQSNLPLDEKSLPILKQYQESLVKNMFFEDYMKSIMKDFHAEVHKALVSQYSGVGNAGGRQPREVASQKPTNAFPEIKPSEGFM